VIKVSMCGRPGISWLKVIISTVEAYFSNGQTRPRERKVVCLAGLRSECQIECQNAARGGYSRLSAASSS
jgi:hypothetical protein